MKLIITILVFAAAAAGQTADLTFTQPALVVPFLGLNSAMNIGPDDVTASYGCGYYTSYGQGAKSIRNIRLAFGGVTSAGGSGVVWSLQDPSTSAGPPMRPDGTEDQTASGALSGISSGSFTTSGNLSADRAMSEGDPLCWQLRFDNSGRQGSDAFAVSGDNSTLDAIVIPIFGRYRASAYEGYLNSVRPAVTFVHSDGTVGGLLGAAPAFASDWATVHTGTTPDEVGVRFSVPVATSLCGAQIRMYAEQNYDFVIYDAAGDALATISVDGNWGLAGGNGADHVIRFSCISLSAETIYRAVVKPTTANAILVRFADVAAASDMRLFGVTDWQWTARTDAGSWTDTNTRLPVMRLLFSGVETGGGSGPVSFPIQ